jgi:hypothetical protein
MAKPLPHFARLDAGEIIKTAEQLARRIDERFHRSGLSKVAATLVELARSTEQEVLVLDQPNIPIRVGVAAVLVAGAASLIAVAYLIAFGRVEGGVFSWLQGLESAMNIAILVGLGVLGLTRLESTWKRRRAMVSLHTLRSLAHVIDMHQLTKDPTPALAGANATASSPKRDLAPEGLSRYLDYCSEMLSLLGKLAALHAQSHQDTQIAQTANEIEVLTTNLARKIWQKIAIISEKAARAD